MNTSSNTFQLIFLALLGFIAVFALLVFSGVIPRPWGTDEVAGEVELWGSLPESTIHSAVEDFKNVHKEFVLKYVYKEPAALEGDLVEALAAGRGPDLVILPHTSIIRRLENLVPLPYETYPQLNFNNNFIREGNLYLTDTGVLALPLYADPLVLYYNVDLLSAARLVNPPTTWKELETVVKQLAQIDANKNITVAAIALGKANNVNNAKDIYSLLTMQAGNGITAFENGKLNITLINRDSTGKNPALEALAFFNRFSDSANALYSWNSAQPEARAAFIGSRLGLYLGFASEYGVMRRQNPQLDIGAAVVPQLSKNSAVTVGRIYGVSLVRGSKNLPAAAQVAVLLSDKAFSQALSESIGLAPARKDLLVSFPKDPVRSIFNQSAIFARGWLDPNPFESTKIFQKLIEDSQAGILQPAEAISRAQKELELLVK